MTSDPVLENVVDEVSRILTDHVGLRPEQTMRGRLRRSIREDASERGEDLSAYLRNLSTDPSGVQSLLNRVTVQETAFFRHPEHFELFELDLLRTLEQPITIWSAGCANGQEAYSLAMILEERGITGSVIATDVSTSAVQRTKSGCYAARELSGLTPQRIARHLNRHGNDWQIDSELRRRVTTLHHNLLNALPIQVHSSQVVFCRNVLIYFSPQHSRAFLDRVADCLPTATLFLGAAETIWQLTDRYATIRDRGTFIYRPQPGTAVPAPPSRRGPVATQPPRPQAGRRPIAAPAAVARPKFETDRKTEPPPTSPQADLAAALNRTGQAASSAGDTAGAVTAFRKCVFLDPTDPMAHLHLGLALQAAGDHPSARRAYSAARLALTSSTAAHIEHATEGYSTADFRRLLDAKMREVTP